MDSLQNTTRYGTRSVFAALAALAVPAALIELQPLLQSSGLVRAVGKGTIGSSTVEAVASRTLWVGVTHLPFVVGILLTLTGIAWAGLGLRAGRWRLAAVGGLLNLVILAAVALYWWALMFRPD